MVYWATSFTEGWKRRQGQLALEWGTVGLRDVETEGLEYVESKMGSEIASPATGRPVWYVAPSKRRSLFVQVYVVVVALMAGVVVVVFYSFVVKPSVLALGSNHRENLAIPVAFSLFTSLQITVMNRVGHG